MPLWALVLIGVGAGYLLDSVITNKPRRKPYAKTKRTESRKSENGTEDKKDKDSDKPATQENDNGKNGTNNKEDKASEKDTDK